MRLLCLQICLGGRVISILNQKQRINFINGDRIPFVMLIVLRQKCVAYFVTNDLNISFKREVEVD